MAEQAKQTRGSGRWRWRIVIYTDKSSSYKSRSVVWCFTTHVQCVVCVDVYCCVHTITVGRRGAAPLGGEEGGGDDHRGTGQGGLGSGERGPVPRPQGSTKCLHRVIISHYNIRQFTHEMMHCCQASPSKLKLASVHWYNQGGGASDPYRADAHQPA